MKICRFNDQRLGLVVDGGVLDVSDALMVLPSYQYPLPNYDVFVSHLDEIKEAINSLKDKAVFVPYSDVDLLSPVANPGKIIAAPVNYQRHLQEVLDNDDLHHGVSINHIQKAGLFLKATSSVVGQSEGVAIRFPERRTDHEIELAVVIGKAASNVTRESALDYVAGYCIALDITVRGPEERSFRKSPDSYTVLGPWLTTTDEILCTGNLNLELRVNQEIRQRANTSDLILGVEDLIVFASSFYTLHPGDVIITGTPEGVSQIVNGDRISATIDSLGTLDVVVSERLL